MHFQGMGDTEERLLRSKDGVQDPKNIHKGVHP